MRIRRQQGYTLTELLVVITIMAVIAAVAAPEFSSSDITKLENATADVVGAIRFAHSEAIRTGESYGVVVDKPNERIRVYRVDTSVNPAVIRYDNYDPLTKQLYDVSFPADESGVILDEVDIRFVGASSSTDYLGFAAGTGVPASAGVGNLRMLDWAYVRLSYENATRTIDVSPMTSRVTVQ